MCDNCGKNLVKDNKIQIDEAVKVEEEEEPRRFRSATTIDESLPPLFKSKINVENELPVDNDDNKSFLSKSFTLKDVLRNYNQEEVSKIEEVKEEEDSISNNQQEQVEQKTETTPEIKITPTSDSELLIESLLNNNQISKIEIDSATKESYKFDNNLKLYFLMNVLNQNSTDDEKLISTFKLKLLA